MCTPDKDTVKAEAHALQCTTAGPYNATPTRLLGVGSACGFGPYLVGIHSISLAARYRNAACSNTLNQGLKKIQAARVFDFAPVLALCPTGNRTFLLPPWIVARKRSILYVVWTAMASMMRYHRTRNRRSPRACSVINYKRRTSLDYLLAGLQGLGTHQSSSNCGHSASHETCVACLSSWTYCWLSLHPLQRAIMYGSKNSLRRL